MTVLRGISDLQGYSAAWLGIAGHGRVAFVQRFVQRKEVLKGN